MRWEVGIFSFLLVAASLAPPVHAAPIQRPTARTLDCTSGGCHANQTSFKVVHNPVSKGSCESCHLYADEKKHTFKLRAEGGDLCTFCHISGGGSVGRFAHKPFERGECLSCHQPHGGNVRFMLRKDDLSKLCASCHNDITRGRSHLHGPVATGSCAACHAAHRSAAPKLLATEVRDLCVSCHDKMDNQIHLAKFVHQPAKADCRKCHEVHASDHVKQLKEEPRDLCLSCHKQVKDQIASATVTHSATMTGEACLNCHTAHAGNLSKLMKAEPIKACLSCHETKVTTQDHRVIPAMTALADPHQDKHGPIREGDCSGCHIAHGSKNEHLLVKAYSTAFYQPFSTDKYELCFSCHDQQLVLEPKTTGLTGFRNGDRNLHFLHVNKSDKGRSCRACHSTHSSTLPLHLRETTPFGKWELPIGYRQTPTGGACQSACHKEYRYDRVTPAVNQVDKP